MQRMARSAAPNHCSSSLYSASFSSSTPSLAVTLVSDPDEVPWLDSANSTKRAVRDEVYEDDIIIAVLGPTGSGKSSFIRAATGDPRVIIGHDLQSCTSEVQVIRCKHPKDVCRNVVFVDTPGFNDTYISDTDTLRSIAAWLANTFRQNITLSGVLYFHRISDVRMSGIPVRNLTLFKKICGQGAWQNITFVTTMWDEVDIKTGASREKDLCEHYWKAVLSRGASVCRFRGTVKAAWEIIDQCQHKPRPLLLQTEIVNKGLPLQRTSAGKMFLMWINDLIKVLRKSLARLQRLLRNSASIEDSADKFRNSLYEKKEELEKLSFQLEKLETPVDNVAIWRSPSTNIHVREPSSSSRNGMDRSVTLPATFTKPILLTPFPIDTIPSAREATIVDGALHVLRLGLQTAGPIAPFAKTAFDTILYIWNSVKAMHETKESLVVLVQDAAYFTTAVVDQARVTGVTSDMCQVISTLVRDLWGVQCLLQRAVARNGVGRYILQPEDEKIIQRCHNAIKNAIEGFHLRAVVLMHNGLRQLQDRVEDLASGKTYYRDG